MATRCTHLDRVRDVSPRTPGGCEECLATGGWWVHLRLCLECGHATGHFDRDGHPVIRSFEPGEDWGWCYADKLFMKPAPRAA